MAKNGYFYYISHNYCCGYGERTISARKPV